VRFFVVPACLVLAFLGERDRFDPGEDYGLIEGRVLDADGAPVRSALVKVFDADSAGRDDAMAEGHTDEDGRYRIPYRIGPWDCCTGLEDARPDVYAEVWQQSPAQPGKWTFLRRSRPVSNHRPTAFLSIDFELAD